MKAWIIKEANTLSLVAADQPRKPGEVKVKVTLAGISHSDVALYAGKDEKRLPLIPSRIAIGLVSESDEEMGLMKGERVLLAPYYREHIRTGDVSGYLQDYVVVPREYVIPLPEKVADSSAIFAEQAAMAAAAIDKLELKKGEYIAIFGTSPFCLLLAQLADYYHAIPLVIGTDEEELEQATNMGLCYALNSNKIDVVSRIRDMTGGLLCECTVLEGTGKVNPQLALSVSGQKGRVCIAGTDAYVGKVNVDLRAVLAKKLTLVGLTDGRGNVPAAVNLLNIGALSVKELSLQWADFDTIDREFARLKEQVNEFGSLVLCKVD
ncbi:MAG: zinc-binding dehydrogenase [Clostridia bacterium]|nr:zinc-binding dehydrogenase [Clostridia bacterium]